MQCHQMSMDKFCVRYRSTFAIERNKKINIQFIQYSSDKKQLKLLTHDTNTEYQIITK